MSDTRDRVTVQRRIPAPAAAIFDLLADPSRHPEIDGSGTVLGVRSPGARRLALGESFGMNMRMGLPYSTRNVVVEFEPDRLIAWQTLAAAPADKLVTGRVWRYELEPVEGGTLVRETWDISRESPLSRPWVRRFMAAQTRENMSRTLQRLEQVLTAASPAAPPAASPTAPPATTE